MTDRFVVVGALAGVCLAGAASGQTGAFASYRTSVELESRSYEFSRGRIGETAIAFGPFAPGSTSDALANVLASSDLATGVLRSQSVLRAVDVDGVHSVFTTSILGDSFRHVNGDGTPYVFQPGDTATVQLDIDGRVEISGMADFGPSGDAYIRVLTLEPGTLESEEFIIPEGGSGEGQFAIGSGSPVAENLISQTVVDLGGSSFVLDVTNFNFYTPDVVATSFPASVPVQIPLSGDFDLVVQLVLNANAFNPNSASPALVVRLDFASGSGEGLTVGYTPPPGVAAVESLSGVFPGTVPFSGDPADLNGDGVVDAADLAALISDWGGSANDLSGDGIVGAADLAALLAAWG